MKDNFYYGDIDYHEIIECLVSALDAKSPYTAGHSRRVSDMALAVCRRIRPDLEYCYKEIEKTSERCMILLLGKYILKNWELIKIIISEKSLENVNQAN